jgi:hypothetical protein
VVKEGERKEEDEEEEDEELLDIIPYSCIIYNLFIKII